MSTTLRVAPRPVRITLTNTPTAGETKPSSGAPRDVSTFEARPATPSALSATPSMASPAVTSATLVGLSSTSPLAGAPPIPQAHAATIPNPPPAPNPFAPWITQTYETLLRRAPTAAEMANATNWIAKELHAGKNIFQAGAEICFFIKISPEYKQAHPLLDWLNSLYCSRLGRYPTDAEIDKAEDLMKTFATQGKNFFQCCQGLDFCICIGQEYKQFHAANPFASFISDTYNKALGRAPRPDEMAAFDKAAKDQGAHGVNWMQICANISNMVLASPEFHTKHPFAGFVQGEYQKMLGRAPSLDEITSGEALICKFLSEGKTLGQAAQGFDFCMALSPEYKAKHPVQGPAPVSSGGGGDVRSRILAMAESQIGTLEYGDSNSGPCSKYPNFFGRGNESWCADFASWVMTHAGVPMNDPYCPSIVNTLEHSGRWKGRSNPQPGDLVLFDWNGDGVADHVGIVKSVNSNGTIETIEGNSDKPGTSQSGVWEHTRSMSTIMGFGNPQ